MIINKIYMIINKQHIKKAIKQKGVQIKGFGVSKIGLFGSYVRGEQQKDSDIDVYIEFKPEAETFNNFMDLYDLLEETFEENTIDIVTQNGLSPFIGPKILKEVEYVEIDD